MGDTRNRNRPADYYREQRQYARTLEETTYVHSASGSACHVAWAGEGLIQQRLSARDCASNWVDVESDLRNTGVTSFIQPHVPAQRMPYNVAATANVYTPAPAYPARPVAEPLGVDRLRIAY